MMFRGVRIFFALHPCFPLGFAHQFFLLAKHHSIFFRKPFRAIRHQHHVRTMFQNRARGANGVLHVVQVSRGSRAQRVSLHHDRVALHASIQIQMRAITRVEDRIVLQDDNRCFDRVQGRATPR